MATKLEFTVLDQGQIRSELNELSAWERDGVAIRKTWMHDSFLDAIEFVNRVAVIAEKSILFPEYFVPRRLRRCKNPCKTM